MRILIIYRHLCHLSSRQGRVVSSAQWLAETGESRSNFYRDIRALIDAGFVIKVGRGLYSPCDVYKWHVDDYAGGEDV